MGKRLVRFFSNKGYNTEEKALEVGDIVIDLSNGESIYLERKFITDFFGSYVENGGRRIKTQALGLSQYKFKAIIVYGSVGTAKRQNPLAKNFTIKSLYKMISNIVFFYNIPVFYVKTEEEFFKLMITIIEVILKNIDTPVIIRENPVKVSNRIDIGILQAYPQIGEKKAKLLLDNFASVEKLFQATDKEILEIKGVGKTLLSHIRDLEEHFRGEK